jgi:hypothetical protein
MLIGRLFRPLVLILLLLELPLLGCKREMSDLETRVRAYYEAIAARDFARAYSLEHHAVRDEIPLDQYTATAQSNPVVLKSFSILAVTIDGSQAKVKMRLTIFVDGQKKESEFYDIWVSEGNNWLHAPN